MLRHLWGSTEVKEDGGNLPLHCDPEQETKKEQPEADQVTTQEAVCLVAASSHHASRGMCLRQDEYHSFKESLHYEEEERLEDNFWVLTLVSGRKEGPDLETVSSQWQPEAKLGENSGKRPEKKQMLGHLRGSTGVEENSGNLLVCCDPEQETTKREQPEAHQETQETVCVELHLASGGAWLR
ncbi:hypothetical protein NDU88_000106 [Pleurodeles waltl]|uniref:Uncharacterized protein n=1 Tax=Pleurodeles waltl TaxID=8319 RepID=A0AAV7TEH9_PLEWA|nr:hypothetical protein NDU88_000106 [Pleurodeles waltl]